MYRYYITRQSAEGVMDFPGVPLPESTCHYGMNGTVFPGIPGRVWGFAEYERELSPTAIAESALVPGPIPSTYYPINEEKARQAKEMMSFSDYRKGTKTAEYRCEVDKAYFLAGRQKKRVDAMYHEKIDGLVESFARRLADNMNKESEILSRCPSVMIAGPANFPVRKKEKQNAAMDRNLEEWREIRGLLDKIKATGTGGISSDDPNAVAKLEAKLAAMEAEQQLMKDVNAWYRKHKTLDGCPSLTPEQIEEAKAQMARDWRVEDKPYPSWALSNNNANIRRVKDRIEELKKRAEGPAPEGWSFDGGKVVMNTTENRLQIVFDGKPEPELRAILKSEGFRWAPSQGAWQRQLTDNAIRVARTIREIAPASEGTDNG